MKGRNGPSYTPCKGSRYKRPCFLKDGGRGEIIYIILSATKELCGRGGGTYEDQCFVSFTFS